MKQIVVCFLLVGASLQAGVKSVKECHGLLNAGTVDAAGAKDLKAYVAKRYGKTDLSKNQHRVLLQKTEDGGGYVLWALKARPGATVVIHAEKNRRWPMLELSGGLFVRSEKFSNFSSVHFRYEVDGVRLAHGKVHRFGFESYAWTKDSLKQPGVPEGKLIAMGRHSAGDGFYKGTQRDWWIYLPAQYDETVPAKLIVFQDGGGYVKGEGNACTVMDNLIHQKKMPVTIGVFVNPGEIPPDGKRKTAMKNRGNEYDTCTPKYAGFLEAEILPSVYEKYAISQDPGNHCIVGSSSGASCAFTAAWHRNDLFTRVISFVGSYCDFRPLNDYPLSPAEKSEYGPLKTAHDYPALIRKTNPPKNIRIFLQDGRNDLDNTLGNWFANNQRMAAALAFSGYAHRVAWGDGMHSKRHGMAILPEAMAWIWQD